MIVMETWKQLSNFSSKKQKEKRKRKAKWCPRALDDLIDIIVSSNSYKKKLTFTSTKNQRNGELYREILKEVKATASARGDKTSISLLISCEASSQNVSSCVSKQP